MLLEKSKEDQKELHCVHRSREGFLTGAVVCVRKSGVAKKNVGDVQDMYTCDGEGGTFCLPKKEIPQRFITF